MVWFVQIAVSALLGIVIAIAASFGTSQVTLAPAGNVPSIERPATTTVTPTASADQGNAAPVPPSAAVPATQKNPLATEQAPKPVSPPPPAPAPAPASNQPVANNTGQVLQATTTQASGASVTDQVRAAIVNIICTTQASGPFGSISGSGVFIDSRGIILTNSHIAQYFLLKNYQTPGFVSCVIRSGSPAVARYTADLLFMPPSWMEANAYKINQADPTGNGEHDYALLLVTGTVNPSVQMPSAFPSLPVSTEAPAEGQSVLLAAYPAQFLGGITVAEDLYESSATATVGDLYTFVSNTLDLFSVGGTIVAQKGSSGGAVTDASGVLRGLIVTASEGANTAASDLRALSTPYIINDFAKESGVSLVAFLNGDIAAEEQQFSANIAPTLRAELENALEHK